MDELDYYSLLGVEPDAPPERLKAAYRERARTVHPDRFANLGPELRRRAEHEMALLNEAYGVLSDPSKRKRYDALREARAAAARPSPSPSPQPAPDADLPPRPEVDDAGLLQRAVLEEFLDRLERARGGVGSWTPMEVAGVPLALQGARKGRIRPEVLLFTDSQLDADALRRQLRRVRKRALGGRGGLWERRRVYGFSAAAEFVEPQRLERLVEAFNGKVDEHVGPFTLLDMMTWAVAGGTSDFDTHLGQVFES